MSSPLGQRLRSAREQLGYSLTDVSHKTRIPVARLQDLEEDNYTSFGSLTYARSFLQMYADLLGVDAHVVIEQMNPTPLGGASNCRYLYESYGAWVGGRGDRTLMPKARPVRPANTPGVVAAVAALLLLIGGVLWAATLWADRKFASSDPALEARLRDGTATPEEIRAALPSGSIPGGSVPIRRALPVTEDPQPARER